MVTYAPIFWILIVTPLMTSGQTDVTIARGELTALKQMITVLQSQISASNSELVSVKLKQQSTETELASVKSSLQTQLLASDTDLKAVKSQLRATENELASVKSQCSSTKSELRLAQADIDNLKQDLTNTPDGNELSRLKTDFVDLKTQFNNLITRVNTTVGSDIRLNTNNIKVLNASCSYLRNTMNNLTIAGMKNQRDIMGLQSHLADIQSSVSNVKVVKTMCQNALSEYKMVESEISVVTRSLSSMQQTLANINLTDITRLMTDVFFEATHPYIVDTSFHGRLHFATVAYSHGNGYNASSGVFTAPVPGMYVFWTDYELYSVTHDTYIQIMKGYDMTQEILGEDLVHKETLNSPFIGNIVVVTKLEANDQVHFAVSSIPASKDSPTIGRRSRYGGHLLRAF